MYRVVGSSVVQKIKKNTHVYSVVTYIHIIYDVATTTLCL